MNCHSFSHQILGAVVLFLVLFGCRLSNDSLIKVTEENTASFHPAWSPDGRRIAFHRRVPCGTPVAGDTAGCRHIFTMNADGNDVKQLTTGENVNFDPAWSRDNRIAFTCNRDQTEEICVINADGSGFVQLTQSPTNSNQPTWSPNSRQIVFWHDCSLWAMNADGTNIFPFLEGSEFNCYGFPAWSPDGTQIAFRLGSASGGAIHVMNADGSNVRKLTDAPGNNRKPTWSPDGKQIAFERDEQIFVMNADGTGEQMLTPTDSNGDRYPDWSPIGDKIAFERSSGSDKKYGDTLYQIFTMKMKQ